jgi:hypothetical protein
MFAAGAQISCLHQQQLNSISTQSIKNIEGKQEGY